MTVRASILLLIICFYYEIARLCAQSSPVDACRNGIFNAVYYTNDYPTHCVINDLSRHYDQCLSMKKLYDVIKRIATEGRPDYGSPIDNTVEYKRINLVYRLNQYDPTINKFNGDKHEYWTQQKAFSVLFQEAGQILYRSHREVHFVEFEGQRYGPMLFCDLALNHFPATHKRIFELLEPKSCPTVKSTTCSPKLSRRIRLNFPMPINMVYYNRNKQPISCYMHHDHYVVRDQSIGNCISFQNAAMLVHNKNDADEDQGYYRCGYLMSRLRLYGGAYIYYHRIEPHYFWWSTMHRYKRKVFDILRDIEALTGFTDDPPLKVALGSSHSDGQSEIEISATAFCTASIEMIPCSNDALKKSMSRCA